MSEIEVIKQKIMGKIESYQFLLEAASTSFAIAQEKNDLFSGGLWAGKIESYTRILLDLQYLLDDIQ